MTEVAGRPGRSQDVDRGVQLALVGQVRGQHHPALGQDVGRRRAGAELLPQSGHPAVTVQGPVAVHHHRELAGVVAAQQTGRLQVTDGLGPAAQAVTDQAVELAGGRRFGDLFGQVLR